jgi:hypothetical protein
MDIMKTKYTIQQVIKNCPIVLVLLGAVPLLIGCTSRRGPTVTTTETRVEYPNGDVGYYNNNGYNNDGHYYNNDYYNNDVRYRMRPEPAEVETTTTRNDEREHSGGGIFSIIGDAIALPFRAVGSVL